MTDDHTPFPLDGGRVGDGGGNASGQSARPRHRTGATTRARRLRREMTVAERILWKELRRLKMNFRRQAPLGRFVVDFVHHESRLVVEVDGYHHNDPDRQASDLERTGWLRSQGYRVIRFSEKEVRDYPGKIAERIEAEAVPPPSPTLPPSRGKGEQRYDVR